MSDYGEPWGQNLGQLFGGPLDERGYYLGDIDGDGPLSGREYAVRIVDCVNALAGMNPAKLAALLAACDRYTIGPAPDGCGFCREGNCSATAHVAFSQPLPSFAERRRTVAEPIHSISDLIASIGWAHIHKWERWNGAMAYADYCCSKCNRTSNHSFRGYWFRKPKPKPRTTWTECQCGYGAPTESGHWSECPRG